MLLEERISGYNEAIKRLKDVIKETFGDEDD